MPTPKPKAGAAALDEFNHVPESCDHMDEGDDWPTDLLMGGYKSKIDPAVAKVALVEAWFGLCDAAGEEQAISLFRRLTKRPAGRKPNESDRELIEFHSMVWRGIKDGLFEGVKGAPTRKTLISFVAGVWKRSRGGQSPQAVEKRLRRLLNKEKQKWMKFARGASAADSLAYEREINELRGFPGDRIGCA